MFRDDRVAGTARIQALEEELSRLRAEPSATPAPMPRVGPPRWALVAGLAVAVLGVVSVFLLGRPHAQTVLQSNTGHMVSVAFWVPVHDITWEMEDGRAALQPFAVPTTDLSGAAVGSHSATVMLPPSLVNQSGETRLVLRYRALGFQRSQSVHFDVNKANIEFARKVLGGLTPWVAFQPASEGGTNLYFTTLLVYKPAIKEIRWGLGDEPLDRRVHFSASSQLGIESDDEMVAKIPGGVNHVRVQLVFKDDTSSPVRTILRSDAEVR